jgi:uncharacterized protein (DUF2461 family)
MIAEVAFQGFKPELLEFLSGLKANNNREWFEAHRADYEAHLLEAARCERPGYFFRLTPESLTLGAGMHGFSDALLARYRQAVVERRKPFSRATYPICA